MYFSAMYRLDYIDIAGRSSAMGRQTRVDGENKLFSSFNYASISRKQ